MVGLVEVIDTPKWLAVDNDKRRAKDFAPKSIVSNLAHSLFDNRILQRHAQRAVVDASGFGDIEHFIGISDIPPLDEVGVIQTTRELLGGGRVLIERPIIRTAGGDGCDRKRIR